MKKVTIFHLCRYTQFAKSGGTGRSALFWYFLYTLCFSVTQNMFLHTAACKANRNCFCKDGSMMAYFCTENVFLFPVSCKLDEDHPVHRIKFFSNINDKSMISSYIGNSVNLGGSGQLNYFRQITYDCLRQRTVHLM